VEVLRGVYPGDLLFRRLTATYIGEHDNAIDDLGADDPGRKKNRYNSSEFGSGDHALNISPLPRAERERKTENRIERNGEKTLNISLATH
jgi:hypothetical protein